MNQRFTHWSFALLGVSALIFSSLGTRVAKADSPENQAAEMQETIAQAEKDIPTEKTSTLAVTTVATPFLTNGMSLMCTTAGLLVATSTIVKELYGAASDGVHDLTHSQPRSWKDSEIRNQWYNTDFEKSPIQEMKTIALCNPWILGTKQLSYEMDGELFKRVTNRLFKAPSSSGSDQTGPADGKSTALAK